MLVPTCHTHLTHIALQVIVDRPDDGCIAETCSLVLLTLIHVVLDCIPLCQLLLRTTGWTLLRQLLERLITVSTNI
jgi:hypothetical protein